MNILKKNFKKLEVKAIQLPSPFGVINLYFTALNFIIFITLIFDPIFSYNLVEYRSRSIMENCFRLGLCERLKLDNLNEFFL